MTDLCDRDFDNPKSSSRNREIILKLQEEAEKNYNAMIERRKTEANAKKITKTDDNSDFLALSIKKLREADIFSVKAMESKANEPEQPVNAENYITSKLIIPNNRTTPFNDKLESENKKHKLRWAKSAKLSQKELTERQRLEQLEKIGQDNLLEQRMYALHDIEFDTLSSCSEGLKNGFYQAIIRRSGPVEDHEMRDAYRDLLGRLHSNFLGASFLKEIIHEGVAFCESNCVYDEFGNKPRSKLAGLLNEELANALIKINSKLKESVDFEEIFKKKYLKRLNDEFKDHLAELERIYIPQTQSNAPVIELKSIGFIKGAPFVGLQTLSINKYMTESLRARLRKIWYAEICKSKTFLSKDPDDLNKLNEEFNILFENLKEFKVIYTSEQMTEEEMISCSNELAKQEKLAIMVQGPNISKFKKTMDIYVADGEKMDRIEPHFMQLNDFLIFSMDIIEFEMVMRDHSEILRGISDFFEKYSENLNENIKKREDINEKYCPSCNQNLILDKFERYSGERGKKYGIQAYRSVCKDCRRKKETLNKRINSNIFKIKVIQELFGSKCNICGIGLEVLPAFHFHHKDSKKKNKVWRTSTFNSIEEVRKWKEEEDIELLCANCHLNIHAQDFNKYKDIILKKDLFLMNWNELDKYLSNALTSIRNQEILSKPTYINDSTKKWWQITDVHHIKAGVEDWIRKRYIIENLFEGQCCGCGTSIQNLSALQFHHIDPKKKKLYIKWNFSNNKIDVIQDILNEKCICLCGNCHSLIESKYYMDLDKINELYSFSKERFNRIKESIQQRLYNISRFVTYFQKQLPLLQEKYSKYDELQPLKKDFNIGENYLKNLIKIYHFSQIRENEFTKNLLAKSFNTKISSLNREIQRLKYIGYIADKEDTGIEKIYYLTDLGIEKINYLRSKIPKIFEELKLEVSNFDFKIEFSKKRIDGVHQILRVSSNLLLDLICKNEYNEFTCLDLKHLFLKSNIQIKRIIYNHLIPNKIISIVENPVYILPKGPEKIYQLTQNGIRIALMEQNNKGKIFNFIKPNLSRVKNKQLLMIDKIYKEFANDFFDFRDLYDKFYSKTSFNSFKVFFYTYISNYKYVIRIKENTYKLTENGIKFLEYFLKYNQIKHFID